MLAGRFDRRHTDTTTWEEAHTFVRPLEDAGSWSGQLRPEIILPTSDAPAPAHGRPVAIAPVSAPAPTSPDRIAIAKAIEGFLTTKAVTVAFSTLRKHKTFPKQLQAFADDQGYVMLDQFRALDIDTFYAGSSLGRRSKAKWLEWLRSFFQYGVNREWLTKSPVSRDLKPPKGSTRCANKVPFTDEQLLAIIKACDQVDTRRWGTGSERTRGPVAT